MINKGLALAVVGLVVSSTPGLAQNANYKRNSAVKIDVKLSDRVKPVQPKALDPKTTRTQLSADDVLLIEGLVHTIRVEQEQLLAELIQSTPDRRVDDKSDLYFQLGELYAKQQRYYRLNSVENQIAADNTKVAAQKTKLEADAAAGAAKAKDYLIKAVQTYKDLTDNEAFRNYPRMDIALFYYGYTLQGGKYLEEARAVYDKLLKNYPNSKYVPEAHLAFADYYFEANQLADAAARYKMVLKFPKSSAFWYAKYKMGWIDLNLRRFQDALEAFFEVAQATKNDNKQNILHRAANKDFVRAYAEIGRVDRAYDAFKRVDPKYAFEMLAILADLYLEQGKSDKAIVTYQELMKTAPTHNNVCVWQYNISHAMLSMPRAHNADKVEEIENLVRLYGALKGKTTLPAAEARDCHDNAAAMSGELARAYHSESAKTKNPETLGYAEKLYRVYLGTFADAPDYAQTRYFYAELLWMRADSERNARLRTERWENAAVAFSDVVKGGTLDPKLMKEAAFAAVLAWKNALDVTPELKPQADNVEAIDNHFDKVPAPKPIPARDAKMIAAFDVYIQYIKDPKDDDLVGMKFLKANLYRRYHHYDKALPLFVDILNNHRHHQTAEFSANLLLDTYNRMGKVGEMLALVDKLGQDQEFLEGKAELNITLAKLKAQSMRTIAEGLENDARESNNFGKFVACGQTYLDIYNRNPTAGDNDEVLYNALVCYHEGKSISAALGVFGTLKQYYPKSKYMPKAVGRIAKAYGDIAFYDQAAEKLEDYARLYGGAEDAFSAQSEAAVFRKGLGQDDKAIADATWFVARYKPRGRIKESADAMFSLTSVYEKQTDPNAVIKHLRGYIAEYPAKVGGADRIVIAHAKIGQALWKQSCPVPQIDGSCVKVTRERAFTKKQNTRNGGNDQPKQCGPESKIKLTVVPRDPRKVTEALAAFAAATKAFEAVDGKTAGDEGGARYYYAQSKFAEADVQFEAYLTLKFPANLNFDPAPQNTAIRATSDKRFGAWVAERTKIGGSATAKYEAILGIKDAATSIAASARLAQISQNLSDALFSAAIPNDVRTGEFAGEKVEAFCDKMATVAEPLDRRALDGFTVCLAKSTELGWFGRWSKLCEHELGQINPEQFPTASELRGDPTRIATVTDVEPPIGNSD